MAVGDTHLLPDGGGGETSPPPATTTLKHNSTKKKRAVIILLTSILALTAIVAVATTISHHSTRSPASLARSHALIRSTCSSTLYPSLCITSLTSLSPDQFAGLSNPKSVIEAALHQTRSAAHHSTTTFRSLYYDASANRTQRERTALHDCLVMFDQTLEEVDKAEADLRLYPGGGKTLEQHAADMKTLLSAAMTNQASCLDGFSHDEVCRVLRGKVQGGCVHIERLCSNALAMVRNLTDGDIKAEREAREMRVVGAGRKMVEEKKGEEEVDVVYPVDEETGFPTWLSASDRKLLQASSVQADAVVAQDGSGNFKTVSAAVAAAPEKSAKRYVIRIKAGTYRENVDVPKKKTNIMFVGDGAGTTVITGSRNVVDGSTTFNSATVAVVGDRFLARDITFQNTAGPSKHQAVALRVGSDFSAFYRCNILAFQDTLYVHSLRQFYRDCLIAGTVDFIFGNAAVVFQGCNLQARKPDPGQKNMFTAQGREDPNQNTGISIQGCTIGAASDLGGTKSYLGRPWKKYSRTVVMKSSISGIIDPAGWHEWSGNFALDTLFYGEYQNTGAGAATGGRVKWKGYKVITSAAEAAQFAPQNFISGSSWLAGTGFPFQLGL